MTENNSPLERLLDWCAVEVESLRLSNTIPSTGEIDDVATRQEIEQVEADMRAVERDHRSLVDAYGAAVQELQRRGAKSVPLTPSTARLRDLLGGYECPKCGGSGRIPVIDLGVGEVIDKVPCPACRPDDTPRRDALEDLETLATWAAESPRFRREIRDSPVGRDRPRIVVERLRRALTAPPTVPEALNIERVARYFTHYLPDHLKPERGSSLQPYMDALGAALEMALAQHSEPGRMPEGLSFAQLRAANVERCETAFHALDHWNPMEWGAACAGEVGEGINAAKKLRRVQDSEQYKQTLPTTDVTLQDVADEIADAVIYADLWAASIGVDLGAAVADKFNRTSDKVRSDVKLAAAPEPEGEDG